MKAKACLFDLDGVVFDTEPQYTLFWAKIAREFRPDVPDMEHLIKGQTLVEIYDRYFGGDTATQQTITDRLNDYERNELAYSYLPGFEAFVERLRSGGIKTAVVTSSNREKMENIYRRHPEFRGYFDAILTSEDFTESKPSPQCYERAAARFGLEPKECIVFEDSFNGLRSGRESGAYVVGITSTNSAEAIAGLCDETRENYLDSKFVIQNYDCP